MYKRQEIREIIPNKNQRDHFNTPIAIHIILCDQENENEDKKLNHKNNTKDGIMDKEEEDNKSNKSKISETPNKSKDGIIKKTKTKDKPTQIQTPNIPTKPKQCCKCCGRCPCCKSPN